jgi:hypothetical protein
MRDLVGRLAVHTATTDNGANTQPKTMSTTAAGVRQPKRRPRCGPDGRSATPVPGRSASSRSASVSSPEPGFPLSGSTGTGSLPA